MKWVSTVAQPGPLRSEHVAPSSQYYRTASMTTQFSTLVATQVAPAFGNVPYGNVQERHIAVSSPWPDTVSLVRT